MLPKVFAECDISIRVLSLEYSKEDEDDLGAEGIAAFLVDETKKLDGHGVLWIAHSFGGPLLRGVLSTDQNLVEVTKGVLFFGVPRDVATGSWGNMSITTTGIEVGLSDEMRRLQKEVRWLAETERAFGVFCVNGKLAPGWFVESSGGLEDTVSVFVFEQSAELTETESS
jgi:predicted alpha/beta hydrolase